jgi:iron complex outermembrane recepter protein
VDYYRTKITDAITPISYQNNNIQNLCLASAPSYSSPFCSLAVRPITDPSDSNYFNPNVNFPTEIRNSPLNAAQQKTYGYDLQINYGWDMGDLVSSWSGRVTLRHLVNYQPENETIQIPGAFPTWAVEPKVRQSTFLSYENGDWSLSLQNQWLGKVKLASSDNALNGNSQNYKDPYLPSYDVLDISVDKRFRAWGTESSAFLAVNNVANTRAPIFPSNSGIPGLFYPTLGFYDDMGRYFTLGIRTRF